jgi:hypothetical protein
MKKRKSKSSSIYIVVLILLFGVLTLAIIYKALLQKTDTDAEAFSAGQVAKNWEFNSNSPEGWVGNDETLSVGNGYLKVPLTNLASVEAQNIVSSFTNAGSNSVLNTVKPAIENNSGNTELSKGSKFIQFRASFEQNNSDTPNGINKSTFNFISVLRYTTESSVTPYALIVRGIADGKFRIYSARIPELNKINLKSLSFGFAGKSVPSTLKMDWIRILSVPLVINIDPIISKPVKPTYMPTCRPRPPCLESKPKCLMPETSDMCPPTIKATPIPDDCTYRVVNCEKDPCPRVYMCDVHSKLKYICPSSPWVDCMPKVGDTTDKTNCSSEYLNWAKLNCPTFKGAAY